MSSPAALFAGIELSSGRTPVTFVVLDEDLNVSSRQRWNISEALSCLSEYDILSLALASSAREPAGLYEFRDQVAQAGFVVDLRESAPKKLSLTNAQSCFHALIGRKPLPARTLEGRLQRTAVLYEQGVQITDPIDVFEEITRFKLIRGDLPLESIYSAKELNAAVAAYVAWLAANRPGQTLTTGEFILPAQV